MLKKNLNEFKMDVFASFEKVCPILTAGDKEHGYNSMLISWGGLGVIWGKKVAFVFVRHSRNTFNYIENSKSVTLSFLSDRYKAEKSLFGSKSGRTIDKYKETNLHATFDGDYDGYYVCESDFVLKMKKLYAIDIPYEQLDENLKNQFYNAGDEHKMYICEIVQYLENEDFKVDTE